MQVELNFENRYRLLREIIETLVLTLLMFLVIHSAIQNFNVDGHSMEPNLHDKELILVDKWSYLFHAPARGDIVVFVAPPDPSEDYVKRIIGIPGDVITINNGAATVDGDKLNETYVLPMDMGATPGDMTVNKMIVPPNDYFVMGDNRSGSSDSRTWGFLPRKNIIGRASLVYWPLGQNNIGLVPNVSPVFAHVSQQVQTVSPTTLTSDSSDQMMVLAMPGLFVIFSTYRRRAKITSTKSLSIVHWRQHKETMRRESRD